MEAELIKTLLKNDTYQATQAKLRHSIFSDDTGTYIPCLNRRMKSTDLI